MKYTGIYILLTVLLLLAACTGKLTEGKGGDGDDRTATFLC